MTALILALILTSSFSHALWNLAAKRVSGNLSVLWMSFWVAGIVALPLAIIQGRSALWDEPAIFFVCATGTLQTAYILALAGAYRLGDISFVYPVARGTGVGGAAILASLLLHEKVSTGQAFGIALICAGTWIMSRHGSGGSAGDHRRSFLLALLNGLVLAFAAVNDKLGVQRVPPVTFICIMFLLSALQLTPYIVHARALELRKAWRELKAMTVFIGLGSLLSYLLVLVAYQWGDITFIVPLRESSVVFGAVLGWMILKETFSARKIAGIAVIVLGLVLVRMS